MELTKSEMQIMDALWEAKVPLSRADLLCGDGHKTWKDSSVHILLNGMLSKGIIREAGVVKRGKTYGRLFQPTMSREEYFATLAFSHRYKPDPVALVSAILQQVELSPEQHRQLCQYLQDPKHTV